MTSTARGVMTWLLAPQVEEGPRSHAIAAVGLRLLAGLLWLYKVSWKRAPDFGQDNDTGLYHLTALAVSDPVFAPYSWVVENLVLPNFTPFGWVVLAAETTLAVLLLSGAFVRLAAALGMAQSVAIGLSAALAPNERRWAYAMMVGIHLVLLFQCCRHVRGCRRRPRRDQRRPAACPHVGVRGFGRWHCRGGTLSW